MVVRYLGDSIYKCVAADTKPSNAIPNAMLIEVDTRKTYYYQSGVWTEQQAGPTPSTTLAGLTGDVNIATPTNDQLLRYNTSLSKWQNATVPPAPTTLTGLTGDVFISSPTNDQLLRYNASLSRWVNATVATGGGGTGGPYTGPYTWYIYKQGSNYKAMNGPAGTAPTGATSTTMSGASGTWTYVRDHFNEALEDTNIFGAGSGAGGKIVFGRGTFTFTDTLMIDRTMTGGARGVALEGQSKGGTIIKFAPTAALTDGILVKTQVEPIIRDLDIVVEDGTYPYPNKVTNIIHLLARTGASAGGLFDNIRIVKQTAPSHSPQETASAQPPIGQRAIYIEQDPDTTNAEGFGIQDNSSTVMHFSEWRKIRISDCETGIESFAAVASNAGNNSFMKFDGIYLWRCKYGFKGDEEFKQSNLSNFIFQAAEDGKYGEYCISIAGPANTICNVTQDVIGGALSMQNATAATVILEPGARLNRVWNVTGTGQTTDVLDLSGSDTNWIGGGNCNSQTAPIAENRVGEWHATSCTSSSPGTGLLQNGLTVFRSPAPNDGTIDQDNFTTNFIGKNIQLSPSTTANSFLGLISAFPVARRRGNFTFTAKWQSSGSLNTRFYIGLAERAFSNTGPILPDTDDTPIPNNYAHIGIGKNTASNFYKVYKGASGAAASTPADFINLETSSNIACDANPHRAWIHLNDARNTAYVSMDHRKSNLITGNIPAIDDPLYIVVFVESVSGAAKTFNVGKMTLAMMR